MKKILFVFVLMIHTMNPLYSQIIMADSIDFLNYRDVMKSLEIYGNKSDYFKWVDYGWLIALDPSSCRLLRNVYPKSEKFFLERDSSIYTRKLNYKTYKVGFDKVTEFFDKRTFFNEVIGKFRDYRNGSGGMPKQLVNLVYIKDNQIAVFRILRANVGFIDFRVTIFNKTLKVEIIAETVE